MSQKLVLQYKQRLEKIQDKDTAAEVVIQLIDDFRNDAGFGDTIKEFLQAGGIGVLVGLACRAWPSDGRLTKSKASVDTVLTVTGGDGSIAGRLNQDREPTMRFPCSIRRMAIATLAEMGNYEQYVKAMEAAGFFVPDALPRMLLQSMQYVDYPVHESRSAYIASKDMNQYAAVDLLNLTAAALIHSRPLFHALSTGDAAVQLCKAYKDPFMLWVIKAGAERAAVRRAGESKRWDAMRTELEVDRVKKRQEVEEMQMEAGQIQKPFMGGLVWYFLRFANILVMLSDEQLQLRLVDEGGLLSRLNGIRAWDHTPMGPEHAIDTLQKVWSWKCEALSQKLYVAIAADEARAAGLREDGNTSFKAGDYSAAVKQYWAAARIDPQNPALFNNLSLAYLKMDEVERAVRAADQAIRSDPSSAKAWCRRGDALRAAGRWQLAHLCYTMALELNPKDDAVKDRADDVRSHLAEVWDIDRDVPHGQLDVQTLRFKAWLNLTNAEFREMQFNTDDLPAWADRGSDDIVERKLRESRGYATFRLKQDVRWARGLAVASGLVAAAASPGYAGLMQPRQLPIRYRQWAVSWTDTPFKDKKTGLISHILSVADNQSGAIMETSTCLGTPGVGAVHKVLLTAMTSPLPAAPPAGRPRFLFVAHRLLPIYSKIAEMCRGWGIEATCETAAEAQQSAAKNDTDWQGYNNRVEYLTGKDDSCIGPSNRPDPRNGHKVEPKATGRPSSGSSSSKKGAGSGSSSSSSCSCSCSSRRGDAAAGGQPGPSGSGSGSSRGQRSTAAATAVAAAASAARDIRAGDETREGSSSCSAVQSGEGSGKKKGSKKKGGSKKQQQAGQEVEQEVPARVKQLSKS